MLRGAGLIDPQGRFNIGLRDRAACASQPNLDGFDVIAFLPASRSVLEDMADRCDRLAVAHSGIQDTPAGPRLDVPDPDGTVLRFYYFTGPTDRFTVRNARRPVRRDLPHPTAAVTHPTPKTGASD